MRTIAALVALTTLVQLFSANPSSAQNRLDLDGDWTCVEVCGCFPHLGDNTWIGQDGRRLQFRNECHQTYAGAIIGPRTITAGAQTGIVSKDQCKIRFSNGTVWVRC